MFNRFIKFSPSNRKIPWLVLEVWKHMNEILFGISVYGWDTADTIGKGFKLVERIHTIEWYQIPSQK